ncbi:MAG TPA: prolyl oligopeptidase family serine peptidase [Dictyoglomaceae bacterium]|nr:prolyl oligopeptidase family serine peptidase [Dictyoglomaceae bacterium]HOL39976.1 prolyl oligopeptidase family serine peptidase [Dictyoglomaceae bacterium]HPP16626.1 prolyl oligopeptidase family serine peptidase [Dictyoglomaceae bacterium]
MKNITLITKVFPEGEKAFAVSIEYPTEIDGAKITKESFVVEAKVKDNLIKRTIKKIYVNKDGNLIENPIDSKGKFLIIELDPKDKIAETIHFDLEKFLSERPKLNYLITQKIDIVGVNGEVIPSFSMENTSEKRLIVDEFLPFVYQDKDLGVEISYRFFIPKDLDQNKKYPLVVFLHGIGERGRDNFLQISAYRGAVVWAEPRHQVEHPCFVLAPQCPPESTWIKISPGDPIEPNNELKAVANLIKELTNKYTIDTKRIYITGLSMGGFGTWALLMENPELFAGAIPICGGGNLSKVERIKDIPIWVFHAEDDPLVSVSFSRDIVKKLVDIGGKVRYTEFEKGYLEERGWNPHWSWIPPYESEEIIDWLFEKRR